MKRTIVFIILLLSGITACYAYTTEDLLSATLKPLEIQAVYRSQEWWPELPEFNMTPDSNNGERFYVIQTSSRINSSEQEYIGSILDSYTDSVSAKRALMNLVAEDLKVGKIIDGPAIGDDWRYINKQTKLDRAYVSTLRFRVGSIIGRISHESLTGFEEPATLAKLVEPVINRTKALLRGEFKSAPVPRHFDACMPTVSAGEAVGPVCGSVVIPAESWALDDSMNDPAKVYQILRTGGARHLGMRRYTLKADPKHVVEVVFFPFDNAAAAYGWVNNYINDPRKLETFDPGKTGDITAYKYCKDTGFYELQFAKGRYAVSVCAYAPFGETQPVCEGAVRQLAESWYQSLPNK